MKTMLSIIFTVLGSTIAVAQKSGVYLTVSDFESGKLSYVINCSTEKHKIKLHEFLDKDYITVVHKGQSINLKKEEIFGYRDCTDKIYRLALNRHFEVLNPTERILLFKIETLPSKSQPETTAYYFSNNASGNVQDLTLTNLKKAFPDNHKFHDALDAQFKTDDDLAAYDFFHKEYKINRIYSNSTK